MTVTKKRKQNDLLLIFSCVALLCSYLHIFFSRAGPFNRGSYMSAHVLLNLLNELRKRDKMRGLVSIFLCLATS